MRKVLVIDDETPTLNMFRLFLGAYGFAVFTAENGTDGLEIFSRERPEIVVTDIKMPGMDGLEVLRRIKELDPQAEVIVITGHGDTELALKAVNLNAADFIHKPIQKRALDEALGRAEARLNADGKREEEITVQFDGEVAVITIKGHVDSLSWPALIGAREKVHGQGSKGVLLKFQEGTSLNGAGINAIIQLLKESRKRDQSVAITGLSQNFIGIFQMVGIGKLAGFFDNAEAAIKQLGQAR
jgi:FixJ family two-component response regulator